MIALDPQIQPLVDQSVASAAQGPPVWEQTVKERRAAYLALADLVGPGPDLARVENLTIAGVPCRLYEGHAPHGILLFLHGGAFVIGDLDTHDEPCRQVALESGATVIAVDYRLAPEHPFPASVEDAWAVFEALTTGRADHGSGDIVIVGDSAGGNLAAVVAIMARDQGLDLRHQLLIYPSVNVADDSPSRAECGQGEYILTNDIIDFYTAHHAADPLDWRASPLLAESLTDVAPALVITAEFDPLRDQGVAYAERLRDEGVDVEHANYEGMVHAFFQLGPLVDAARQAVTHVAETARRALNPDATTN